MAQRFMGHDALLALRHIREGSIDSGMSDSEPSHIPNPTTEPGFDLGHVPPPVAPATARAGTQTGESYRVLARAYRPQTFAQLIGQDAMVQTLGNAIARDRLAHAFLMTGVRGVGKTSTARLIAKALNCIGPTGDGGPTIDPCGVCSHCTAIAEGRHIDVQEMDAASHTGIDDIREITDAVRYASVSARYKIYIIDEVHMLSKQAFNGLLKTLEEPPPHVKFLFATTEVNKVPVTILSRCQRFDLRRITPDLLSAHFIDILGKEGVAAEDAAVRMIASAAEGSVRDGLSLLDQAIAHAGQDGDGTAGPSARITAASVRDMLGLSDSSAIRTLFSAILQGDSSAVIDNIRAQYALGAEPLALVRGIMELTHAIMLTKLSRDADPLLSEEDRASVQDWSLKLGNATLHRVWQLLLKGHQEIIDAPRALEACEMALLRIMHASQMPDPGELTILLAQTGSMPSDASQASQASSASVQSHGDTPTIQADGSPADGGPAERDPAPSFAPAVPAADQAPSTPMSPALGPISAICSVPDLIATLEQAGFHQISRLVQDHLRLVQWDGDSIIYAQTPMLMPNFAHELAQALRMATQRRWHVSATGAQDAAPSLLEQAETEHQAQLAAMRAHPLVDAALKAFPDAHILGSEAAQGGTKLH